ncbi:MAG: YtxH domain-containing protein [Holophaga sp.]|nr:YtxH domain-containing protein [Holophaga sp.]
MSNENETTSLSTLLLTFFAGAAVGAVVTALATRKTGPQLRQEIRDLVRRANLKAGRVADEAAEAWDGVKDRTVLAASDLKRGVTDAANDLRG